MQIYPDGINAHEQTIHFPSSQGIERFIMAKGFELEYYRRNSNKKTIISLSFSFSQ